MVYWYIGFSAAFLILILIVCWQRKDIKSLMELTDRLRDRCSSNNTLLRKLDKGMEWILMEHGVKLEDCNASWWNEFLVKPVDSKKDALAHLGVASSETRTLLSSAIYEAMLCAMNEHDKVKEKKKNDKKRTA